MILPQFEYAAPATLAEAAALLQQHPGGRVLAGGHALLPGLRGSLTAPVLVDLRHVAGLAGIQSLPEGGLRIGAMTTFATVAADARVRDRYAALAEAADSIGDAQVRNRGTVGGNLADGHPGDDLPAAALALGGTVVIHGPEGQREAAADGFFVGPGETALRPGEIITHLDLPAALGGSAYEKFEDPASNYAICGVAAHVVAGANGTLVNCTLGITGGTARPERLHQVEAALEGKVFSAEATGAALSHGLGSLQFVTDLAASADYRAHLATVLAGRALRRAFEAAQHSHA